MNISNLVAIIARSGEAHHFGAFGVLVFNSFGEVNACSGDGSLLLITGDGVLFGFLEQSFLLLLGLSLGLWSFSLHFVNGGVWINELESVLLSLEGGLIDWVTHNFVFFLRSDPLSHFAVMISGGSTWVLHKAVSRWVLDNEGEW